jgi:hypothetical protein
VKQLSILLILPAIMRESYQPHEMEVTQLGPHFYRQITKLANFLNLNWGIIKKY